MFHIQTEDSGTNYRHIITHLFADGGRIVASRKTSYSEHMEAANLQEIVKKLMQAQHKAMFIALRDGAYDDDGPNDAARDQATHEKAAPKDERKASMRPAAAVVRGPSQRPEPARPALYQGTRPASEVSEPPPPPKGPVSIFGGDLLSEKSLDEVILNYLAADEGEDG